jgi:carboxypeptidase Taq
MAGPAPQPDPFARVVHRFAMAGKIGAAQVILSWDAQTHMPRGGAWARGEEMAALTEVSADLIGSDAAGDELAEAEAMAGALEPDERADLVEMRRRWVHAAAVPKEPSIDLGAGQAGERFRELRRALRRAAGDPARDRRGEG